MTESVNQYQGDFVTIKQANKHTKVCLRFPEGGVWSHVVDAHGLWNRRHKLIVESRRSKLLMSLQVETWSSESASRWPAGHWVTCPPTPSTRPLRLIWHQFLSWSIQVVFQVLDDRSVLLCFMGVVVLCLCCPSLKSLIWQPSAKSLAVSQSEQQAASKWNANEPLHTIWAK